MKNNFCTLFDSHFLIYGLALYESLQEHCKSFHLHIFAFDDECYHKLVNLNLANVTIISLTEFENERLLSVKPTRTRGEYCWTCASSTILYCLEKFDLPICTYLDSDLFFYNDPSILIEELGVNDDVLITEHRYTAKYDQSATSGIYCVQFMTFRNTQNGLHILNWWCNACIDWCFNRVEDGKFGDQKYLDDWTTRFNGVHVLKNLGGGVAPWNIQQYKVQNSNTLLADDTSKSFNLVFYHFHDIKFTNKALDIKRLVLGYNKKISVYKAIYESYLKMLNSINTRYNLGFDKIELCYLKLRFYLILNVCYFNLGFYLIFKWLRKIKHGICNYFKNFF